MGKKGKEEKKDSEDHNVHTLLGQPALVQIVDRGLTGKSDQDKKVIIAMIVTTIIFTINLICVTFQKKATVITIMRRRWPVTIPILPTIHYG